MRNMRATLAKQIFVDHPDQAAIQKNADQLKQQLSTMIDEYVKAGLQINGVLSSGQRAEVQKIIAEHQELARRREARWHEHEMHHEQMHHGMDQGQPGGQAAAIVVRGSTTQPPITTDVVCTGSSPTLAQLQGGTWGTRLYKKSIITNHHH